MFRESAFAHPKVIVEPVETPAGPTFVRVVTVGEKDEFDRGFREDGKFRPRLILLACCKEDGSPEFTIGDLPTIEALPLTVMEPIIDAALSINRIGPKEQDDLRKN